MSTYPNHNWLGRFFFSTQLLMLLLIPGLFTWTGCVNFLIPSTEFFSGTDQTLLDSLQTNLTDQAEQDNDLERVGDLTRPVGANFVKVEGIGMVTRLSGTGSDPAPSGIRQSALREMQKHKLEEPNKILASPSTALVMVRGIIPPGLRKGDSFDLDLRVPNRSQTTDLAGGYLLQVKLTETQVIQNRVHTGHPIAVARGAIITKAESAGTQTKDSKIRGKVLAGGKLLKDRPLGLAIAIEYRSSQNSAMISSAINRRFHIFKDGSKQGAASPKRDNFLTLQIPEKYRHNVSRYLRVIQEIPTRFGSTELAHQLETLQPKLLNPESALLAALQLEAIGKDAVPILKVGLESDSPHVRFYAAEALAYLNQTGAAIPLARLAQALPALRWKAITALESLDTIESTEQLIELLHNPSAETRYGAFRALRRKNITDPSISQEHFLNRSSCYQIATRGTPMVHLSRTRHAEVVLFGQDIKLQSPAVVVLGNQFTVKSTGAEEFQVIRYYKHKQDQKITCSNQLHDILKTIAKLGGTYAQEVQFIQTAKQKKYLSARVEVDALPRPARKLSTLSQHAP